MVAAQRVEIGVEAAQPAARLLQSLLHVAQRVGQCDLRLAVEAELAADDHVRHLRPHQAGEVALDAVAQPAQLPGS